MKKILGVMLALLTSATVFGGCFGSEKEKASVVGKEAAQLLLAEQRLNEKLLKNEKDFHKFIICSSLGDIKMSRS